MARFKHTAVSCLCRCVKCAVRFVLKTGKESESRIPSPDYGKRVIYRSLNPDGFTAALVFQSRHVSIVIYHNLEVLNLFRFLSASSDSCGLDAD